CARKTWGWSLDVW
nr:immunoglobulin heavy chain junction region [Macaca mulatta]